MKRTYLFFLLLLMLASIRLRAQVHDSPLASPPGLSQMVAAFAGGSVQSATGGTCVWYFPVLGNLNLSDLFASEAGSPVIDKEHAYLIWVSDWSIEAIGMNSEFGPVTVTMAVIPAGSATIYYKDDPTTRDWSDYGQRGTWGVPIATFQRGKGLFHSPDGFQSSDTFYFSAKLLGSTEISLHGSPFNVRKVIPNGMTCFEYGKGPLSSTETGACLGN